MSIIGWENDASELEFVLRYWEGEQTIICHDPAQSLLAVIAVHSTRLGSALGGIRVGDYPSLIAAVREAHGLAEAMTAKNAFAEIDYGGAKSVILQQGPIVDRRAFMLAFKRFVERTAGSYTPGVDMGTHGSDLAIIGEDGAPVTCATIDPSTYTAEGVRTGIVAAARSCLGGIEGRTVLIQGVGRVGRDLAAKVGSDGARVIVADKDETRAAEVATEVGGTTVPSERVLETPCDVFAPCGPARILTPETIQGLRCTVIAGAANDLLSEPGGDRQLRERGIWYVPDFVINAGGVIQIDADVKGLDEEQTIAAVRRIGTRVTNILAEAREHGITPREAAYARVRERLTKAAALTAAAAA